jgi:hypothetical protein
MSGYDYWSNSTQAEKKETLENDRDTYLRRAEAAIELEAAGRFKQRQEMRLTGNSPDPIPRQPPNSPWAQPDRNVEPPFGDVNEMEPVGSPQEIERSLPKADADPAGYSPSPPAVDRVGQEPVSSSSALTETGSPNSKRPATSFVDPSEVAGSAEGVHSQSPSPSATHSRKSFRRF